MNSLETALYSIIGLALKGRDKMEESAQKLSDEQRELIAEGRKFVENMTASAAETKEEVMGKSEELVRSVVDRMGLAGRDEVNELKKRIFKLEEEIRRLKGK